jgi:hypothetical protein
MRVAGSRLSRGRSPRALASACAVVGRRAYRSSVSRSSSVMANGGIGRPVRIGVLLSTRRTPSAHNLFHLFQTHETGSSARVFGWSRISCSPRACSSMSGADWRRPPGRSCARSLSSIIPASP